MAVVLLIEGLRYRSLPVVLGYHWISWVPPSWYWVPPGGHWVPPRAVGYHRVSLVYFNVFLLGEIERRKCYTGKAVHTSIINSAISALSRINQGYTHVSALPPRLRSI